MPDGLIEDKSSSSTRCCEGSEAAVTAADVLCDGWWLVAKHPEHCTDTTTENHEQLQPNINENHEEQLQPVNQFVNMNTPSRETPESS
eukprot:scaffold4880_cov173-Skeletonema_dohrnii-CCMP3373.AAC.5